MVQYLCVTKPLSALQPVGVRRSSGLEQHDGEWVVACGTRVLVWRRVSGYLRGRGGHGICGTLWERRSFVRPAMVFRVCVGSIYKVSSFSPSRLRIKMSLSGVMTDVVAPKVFLKCMVLSSL